MVARNYCVLFTACAYHAQCTRAHIAMTYIAYFMRAHERRDHNCFSLFAIMAQRVAAQYAVHMSASCGTYVLCCAHAVCVQSMLCGTVAFVLLIDVLCYMCDAVRSAV